MTASRGTASPGGVASPFAGTGTIRALGRRLDWASTSLGAPDDWPQSLRTAVDLCLGSPLPTFVWWGPSLVQLYNDAALEIVRTRHPAAFGAPAAQGWADVWETVRPLAERVLATGEAIRGRDVSMTPDRADHPNETWFTFSYGAARDESGSVAGLFVTATEAVAPHQRTAEEALRRSEAKYHALFDSIDEGFCVIEMLLDAAGQPVDYRFLETNPAFTRQTGIADAVGRTMREVAPAHEEYWYEAYGRVALTGDPSRFEARAEALGRWYDVYAFRVGEPSERRVAILFNDVAARKPAEAALLASESRYRALVTASADVLYSMSPDWSEMRRLDGRGFVSDNVEPSDGWLSRYIPPDDRTTVTAAIQEAVRTKSAFELEHRVLRDDGTLGWTSSRAVPLLAADGAVTGWIGAASDVTARRDAEEALRVSEARQAYLLALSDALRPLGDPMAIQAEAARLLGEWLAADRALYADTEEDTIVVHRDWVRGIASMAGRYPASVWGEYIAIYQRGEPYVVDDAASDPRIDAAGRAAYRAVDIAAFIGVGLMKGGVHVASFGVHSRTPRAWTAEEVALVRETAERTWAAGERARAELALRESEAKYRTIFESIDEGFGTHEVLYDDAGRPVDIRYLETNPAFERHTGVSGCVGRTVREISPNLEDAWIETFARVARTGEPLRFEQQNADVGRWYNVYLSRVGGDGSPVVAAVFNDITARKQAEAALRAAVVRDGFLVRLADALRPLGDPVAVQAEAMRVLGEHFGAVRAQLWEADSDGQHFVSEGGYARGMASLAARIRPEDYGVEVSAIFRAGRTLAVADTAAHTLVGEAELAAYRAVGIGSFVGVPLVKDGEWVCVLGLHRAEAHEWTPDEVALVEETAERTWAAVRRARAEVALRESEEKYRLIFDSIDEGFATLEVLYGDDGRAADLRYLEVNRAFGRQSGLAGVTGRVTSEELPTLEPEWLEAYARVARTGEPARFEQYVTDTERWFDVYMSRVGGEGSAVVATVFNDITERKRAAISLVTVAARDAFLVHLADALRSLFDPAQIVAEATRLLGEHLMVDRASYVEVDIEAGTGRVAHDWVRSGAVSVAGEHQLSDFGRSVEVLRRGERIAVSDTRASPLMPPSEHPAWAGLGIVGFASVPLINGGRLLGALSVTVDQPRVWHEWEMELIEDVAGRVWSSIERARAESALRDSETRNRIIVEGARDYAIMTTDPQGLITSWSPGAEATFGWTMAEAVAQPFALIFVPEDRATGAPERELALAAERGIAPDVRWHQGRDGTRVFMEGSTRALHDARGRLNGFLKVGQDVTSRRALDDALRAGEARYRTLVENVGDYAIFLLDADGIVTDWTPGAQRVMIHSTAEVMGRHVAMFYTPEDSAAGEPARELAEAVSIGRAEREGWRVRKGGTRFWANEITTTVRDRDGYLVGFTRIARDLTERRQAEAAAELVRAAAGRDVLRRRLAMAEEDERRRLSRELHDEAGQHLTALMLGLQALQDVVQAGTEADRRAAELWMHAATLGREIHAVAVRLRPRALDDFGIEAALSAYAEDWARQSGIALDVHARVDAERLPSVIESALYRIVQEALSNVARHSGATRASVVVERRDGHVVTVVEDDGRGFEPDEHVGAPGVTSGLGLLGMRERAAMLGGSLDIESTTDGGGTTLFVRLPLAHPDAARDAADEGGVDG